MTIQNPPIFLQGGSHPAEDVRRQIGSTLANRRGIVGASDLLVTEKSGTPNMSVDVAGGQAYISGDEATYQGMYFVENRGTANLTVSAADSTNPRKDLVVAKVEDSGYSGATDAWSLAVVTGTPAASPSDPSVPNNAIVLARVDVAAGATSITNANITDLRTSYNTSQYGRAAALGGTIACTSTTRPTGVSAGTTIYETDKNRELIYDGTYWRLRGIATVRTRESVTVSGVTTDGGVFATTASWTPDYIGTVTIVVDAHLDFDSAGHTGTITVQRKVGAGSWTTVEAFQYHDYSETESYALGFIVIDSQWTPGSTIEYRALLDITTGVTIAVRGDSNVVAYWEGRA